MAFGYHYTLHRQKNGWWLVRFPGIPQALTEGETKEEARANALDCVIAALEGYMKQGSPLPRDGARHSGADRVVLPSLVTAKLAVYETLRARGWSKLKLAKAAACRKTPCAGCLICATARTCGSLTPPWPR